MPKMVQSLNIGAPVQIVWDNFTNPTVWQEISTDSRVDVLTSGPFGVGSRWRETRTMLGRDSSQEWEVTRMDEPSRFTCVSDAMSASWVYELFAVPTEEGARLFTEFDITPRGVASRASFAVVWPLMSLMMRRGVERDLARFVKRCEDQAAPQELKSRH